VKSFLTTVLPVLVVSTLLFLPAVVDGKPSPPARVKMTVSLDRGADLVLIVDDEIGSCGRPLNQSKRRYTCIVKIKAQGEKEDSLRLQLLHDGSWQAFGPEEDEDEDDAAGDDDDSAGDDDDSAGDDDDSADWQSKPVLTDGERIDKIVEKQSGKFTVMTAEGVVAGDAGSRTLTISSDLLPEGNFLLGTNGYFGVNYGGVKLGSARQSGVIKVKR